MDLSDTFFLFFQYDPENSIATVKEGEFIIMSKVYLRHDADGIESVRI